jgi:hypothetical protein
VTVCSCSDDCPCPCSLPQLISDQPWTLSRRRQLLLSFFQAKLECGDEGLQLEGAVGAWELAINKDHHADMAAAGEALGALVKRLASPNLEVC